MIASLVLAGAVMALTSSVASASGTETVLVKVAGDYSDAKADRLAARAGARIVRRLPQIGWVELEARSARSAVGSAASLRAVPGVAAVDEFRPGERLGFDFKPSDKIFNTTFNDGTTSLGWHFILPNFFIAWDQTKGSSATRVAVIDSEFDTDNPDLRDKLLQRYNVQNGSAAYHTGDVKAKSQNDAFHGSHVAGLVGGSTDNGMAGAGACFDCTLMVLRVGGAASGTFVNAAFLGDITEAILYATDNGAKVINMSLGGSRPHDPLRDAVNYAYARGVTLVASAGNDQQTKAGEPNYPASYDHVIGVGATTTQDQIADFSRQGPMVDVSAPGKDVVSTVDGQDPQAAGSFNGDPPAATIGLKSGTSMAAPIVAGLVGLMKSVRPDLTPDEVERILKSTSRDLGAVGPDPIYGAGRIDAGQAVKAAREFTRPAPPAPPAAPAPAPAPVAPAIPVGPTLTASGRKLGKRAVAFRLACPADEVACTGEVKLTAKRVGSGSGPKSLTLGRRSFVIQGGKSKALTVSLSSGVRKKLRRWRKATITLAVEASDSQGNDKTTRLSFSVKPRSVVR